MGRRYCIAFLPSPLLPRPQTKHVPGVGAELVPRRFQTSLGQLCAALNTGSKCKTFVESRVCISMCSPMIYKTRQYGLPSHNLSANSLCPRGRADAVMRDVPNTYPGGTQC